MTKSQILEQTDLNSLLLSQRDLVNHFFDNVHLPDLEEFLSLIERGGTPFFSGVGKSAFIAQKIAATLSSVGTPSYFISPVDALHGDLGRVSKGDIFICLSKSGETDELLALLPFVRNKGAYLVAWVCEPESRLARASDLSLILPLSRELCPFNLAPVTSSVLQLLLGNILTVALMHKQHFSSESYAENHPAGRIGKRITYLVEDLMLQGDQLPIAASGVLLVDLLFELSNKRCGCLLVVDDTKKLLGIFTDGDLGRALKQYGSEALNMPIESMMTLAPRVTQSNVLAWTAMKLMEVNPKAPITVLPVLDDGELVGLIKMHDILQSGL